MADRCRGSSASRRASPSTLNESTTAKMASPGNTAIHHASWMNPRPSASIRPHEGSGGWVPSPMNESAASARMAKARLTDVWTITGAATLGSTWRPMMRASPAPIERAARTYTSSRTLSALARVTRAKIGVYTMPMAIMALVAPRPRMARMAMASRIAGKANSTSMHRMITSSSHPR